MFSNIKILLIFIVLANCTAIESRAERKGSAESLQTSVDALLDPKQLDATSIVVVNLDTGREMYELNGDLPLKPASVMKLVTSNSALEHLGGDYSWKTQVGINDLLKGKAKSVVIRGSGDPSLTTETLWQLTRQIYKAGVREIDSLILDDSAFVDQWNRSGGRAYESGPSALAFNFNSMGFSVCPTANGKPATVVTDPWEIETSLVGRAMTVKKQGDPVAVEDRSICNEQGCRLAFEVGGTVASDSPCIDLFRSLENPKDYIGRVMVKLLRNLGIGGALKLQYKAVTSDPDIAFEHSSIPLRQVLVGLNNFSTNVTANQIVYAIGAGDDKTLSFKDGLKRMTKDIESLGVDGEQIKIIDGSGLSHDNRLSSRTVVKILEKQHKNIESGIEFQASLSIWGQSGTLKKRSKLPEGVVVRGKTGSLDFVSAVAGYIFRDKKAPLAFAILQNRVASKAEAVDIEDRIIDRVALSP